MSDKLKSLKEIRQEKEKKLTKQNSAVPFPGWKSLEDEKNQEKPRIIFTVKDAGGQVVNTVDGTNKKGFNRVTWNLSYANRTGIKLKVPKKIEDNFLGNPFLATPGTYTVTMSKQIDGKTTQLADPVSFLIQPLEKGVLPANPHEEIASFREFYQKFQEDMTATNTNLQKSKGIVNAMMRALDQAKQPTNELTSRIYAAKQQLLQIDKIMNGSTAKNEIGERNSLSPNDGSFIGIVALRNTYGPTGNHKAAFNRAKKQLSDIKSQLKTIVDSTIPAIEQELKNAGAPYIEGQGLIKN